jgi:hypothetical protein
MTSDFREADLTGLRGWDGLASVSYLLLEGARHAPRGFIEWALEHGASLDEAPAREPVEPEQRFSQEWRSA